MEKINVIDLDGTLVRYDTFFLFIKKYAFDIGWEHIFIYALLRRFNLISRTTFSRLIIKRLHFKQRNKEIGKRYAKDVILDLNHDILQKVESYTDDKTTNILCSASPYFYVNFIASHLSWDVVASDFDRQGQFIHVYGINKLHEIRQRYPADRYHYNYAIADSTSDFMLLREFATFELLGSEIHRQTAINSSRLATPADGPQRPICP